jgi:hypothetical protein
LTFGGRTTAALAFNISAVDLQSAINFMMGKSQVAYDPVVVSRADWIRGYQYRVTFRGVEGNVGLIKADASTLVGDNPEIDVKELVQGNADIAPGDFTYDVQTVRTRTVDSTSLGGAFNLMVYGYESESISYNETAASFKQKLEKIPSIYTVAVNRETIIGGYNMYSWTITFAHNRKPNGAFPGAGNIPPITVSANSMTPTTALVEVFHAVYGTKPLQVILASLRPFTRYNVRVTAYNERGYSSDAALVSVATSGQPSNLLTSYLSVYDSHSLNVSWTSQQLESGFTDGFEVDYYTSDPISEVQVVTISSRGSLYEVQRITCDFSSSPGGNFSYYGNFRLELEEHEEFETMYETITKTTTMGKENV